MEFSWNVGWLLSVEKKKHRARDNKSGWALKDDIGASGAGQPNDTVCAAIADGLGSGEDRNMESTFTISRIASGTAHLHDLHQSLRYAAERKLIKFSPSEKPRLAGRTDESEQAVANARTRSARVQ